ncbi:MAG: hypothetical protein HYS27_18600 [Deltaproteobacteria bacterium]|nr:hypothetical protein [Deltaproteobacteria bacterium]
MLTTRLVSLCARALALAAPLTITACPGSPFWQSPTNDPPLPPVSGDDVPQPTDDVPPGDDVAAPACPPVGGISYERPRPNVMLLVDRSGSMAEPDACGEATCPSKWQTLLALGGYLNDIKGHARLGLSVYPAPGETGCGVSGGVLVPLSDAPDIDQQILDAVMSIGPDGRTPIAEALDEVALAGGLDDPGRDNVVVLLTDGQPNCACTGNADCERERAVEAVERLADRTVPIKVDVVGFGSGAAASDTLAAMAAAAGTAPPDPVGYFQAANIEELIARLYQVAAGLAPCRFNLDEAPAAGDLKVWLDDALVPPCTTETCDAGYTYDENAGVVELQGASCAAIRDGACHNVWFDTVASE